MDFAGGLAAISRGQGGFGVIRSLDACAGNFFGTRGA